MTRDLGHERDIITDMAIKLAPGAYPSHSLADATAKYRTLVPKAQLRDRQVEAGLQVIHEPRHVKHVAALTHLLPARS